MELEDLTYYSTIKTFPEEPFRSPTDKFISKLTQL